MRNLFTISVILFIALASCKKPFAPVVVSTDNHYLVVEGLINTGTDSTYIKLSRTTKLADTTVLKPELKAQVTVEDEQNGSYKINEIGKGVYGSPSLNLNNTKNYRVRIKTADGKIYLSDFSLSKVTPKIDSINWVANDAGLTVYANAHDDNNATRYYRFEYTDEWEYTSKFRSSYKWDNGIVQRVLPPEDIWHCWKGSVSSTINIATTEKLDKDVLYESPVIIIPSSDERVSIMYSIVVKQFAVTKDQYAYYENLKKNTEQLGSIFDALPTENLGNIHCLNNPAEPVLGYIGAGTIQTSQRIFISLAQLPKNWLTVTAYNANCGIDLLSYLDDPLSSAFRDNKAAFTSNPLQGIPLYFVHDELRDTILYSTPICVDCRLNNGLTKKPVYWPY